MIYGVTIDDTNNLPELITAIRALPERPTVRVVLNVGNDPAAYLSAVRELSGYATVMGELLDSSDEKQVPVSEMTQRTRLYLDQLGSYVGIWEVGNEVNGNWLGPSDQVSSRLVEAYRLVSAAGSRTALTLYANEFGPNHCGDGPDEATPEQFSTRFVPSSVRDHLDYVFLSYYPGQCGGMEPSSSQLRAQLVALHQLYPSATLGLGEVGLAKPVTPTSLSRAAQIMRWAYSLDPGLFYYAGGYFWWYAAEDALGPHRPLASNLDSAFREERLALGTG